MKKKWISILLGLCMTIGLLAGCGQKPAESTEKAESTPVSASQESKTESAETPEEIPTLTVFAITQAGYEDLDFDENDTVQYLEEELGIDLEFELVPKETLSERITLAITSKKLPDVFYFPSSVAMSSADLLKYGQSGVIAPIDGILEEHFPNLYHYMTTEVSDGLNQLYESDGHIYATPNISELAHIKHSQKVWTNQMFLEALNMDMPETLEEYEAYLQGVIEKDVNGNGDPDDEVGLVGFGGNAAWYRYFMNSFVYTPGDTYEAAYYIDNATKQVMCSNVQDGYREGLRWINSLWEQGLIYEESLTMSEDQAKVLYMNETPIIAGLGYFAPFVWDTTYSTPTYAQLRIQTPLSNNGGDAIVPWNKAGTDVQLINGGGIITTACENIEAAARFLDYHYSRENAMVLMFGPDYKTNDKYVVLAEDGDLNCVGEPAIVKSSDSAAIWDDNHALMNWQLRFLPRDLYFRDTFDNTQDLYGSAGATAVLQQATDKLTEYTTDKYATILSTARISAEDTAMIASIQTQLDSFVAQWDADFIMGNKSLDDDWDEYVDGLYKIGLQKVIDAYQKTVK